MFVSLQNVTSGMVCLLTPVFYKQIKSINLVVLVISRKALHSVLYVYTMDIFILCADNFNLLSMRNLGDLQLKPVLGVGNYTYN